MNEQLLDIYARLNLYEALLAIVLANAFHEMANPQAQLAQFRSDLLDRLTHRVFPPSPAAMDSELYDRSVEVARTFFRKVEERLEDQTTQ